MAESVGAWQNELREYAIACRAATLLPEPNALTPPQEWHCRIVGSTIRTWLRETGPQFLRQRKGMAQLLNPLRETQLDGTPAIVFTSDVSGLVAAQALIGPSHDRVIYLLEHEYAALPVTLTDTEYRWHVHFWSLFRAEPDLAFVAEGQSKHPIASGVYWQHSEGTMWAPLAGRGVDHLWQWDGKEPKLLEEAMTHWVS